MLTLPKIMENATCKTLIVILSPWLCPELTNVWMAICFHARLNQTNVQYALKGLTNMVHLE